MSTIFFFNNDTQYFIFIWLWWSNLLLWDTDIFNDGMKVDAFYWLISHDFLNKFEIYWVNTPLCANPSYEKVI